MALLVFITWNNKCILGDEVYTFYIYSLRIPVILGEETVSDCRICGNWNPWAVSHSESVNFLNTCRLFLEISQSNNLDYCPVT